MATIREPAVAGLFYPDNPEALQEAVKGYLESARVAGPIPKAIIVPHAGYVYSGLVAAGAYALVAQGRSFIKRVVLLGTAHRVALSGLAATQADFFMTPLGSIPIDIESIKKLSDFPQVLILDQAHDQEHSLEVQLPFLQMVLDEFQLIPMVVGSAPPEDVAEVIEQLWGEKETLIVVSSDLSHYYPYEKAVLIDRATALAIEELQLEKIRSDQACGAFPIRGLLTVVRRRGLTPKTIDLKNSGDVLGSKDQVVGYGAFVFA